MADATMHPALRRLLQSPTHRQAYDTLTRGLSGADLTSLLMATFADRAKSVRAADLLRQYGNDRFVAPSPVDGLQLARANWQALQTAAPTFEPVTLAPVVPFGTHFAMGATPQNNVVSTARLTEVAADPTNSLALEAATRRSRLLREQRRSTDEVKLAASHRVTRAQHFDGPRSFAHFSLFGLVTAGRDRGNLSFELAAIAEHVQVLINVVQAFAPLNVTVAVCAFNPHMADACAELCRSLESSTVSCSLDPDRDHGRGYYRNVCFKVNAVRDGTSFEVGDGGDVGWTQGLVQSRKERLVISGLGLDRLVMVATESG